MASQTSTAGHSRPRTKSQPSFSPVPLRTVTAWASDAGRTGTPYPQLQKILITWMNVCLRKAGSTIVVKKLAELRNKRVFHWALLAILGETIPHVNGTSGMSEEEISADDWALLEKHMIRLSGVSKDMVESDFASGLALLWCLFTTVQTKRLAGGKQAAEADSASSSNEVSTSNAATAEADHPRVSFYTALQKWFTACVASVDSALVVQDLHLSWCDGQYFRAILRAIPANEVRQPAPEVDEHSSITDIMQQLKDFLGLDADRLLTESDFQSKRNLESMAMLVNLTLIHEQFFMRFPRFSKSLALPEVAEVHSRCSDLKSHYDRCLRRYNSLCPDDPGISIVTSVTEDRLRECNHGYFVKLLIIANGVCHHRTGDCQAVRNAAGKLYNMWQVKRRRVWQALLADRLSHLDMELSKKLKTSSKTREMVQEQLPCTAEQLSVLHSTCREAVSSTSILSMQAKSDIRHIERFVEQNSMLCEGAGDMLRAMSACQKASSMCRKWCAESKDWLDGLTQACQYLDLLVEVEHAVAELHSGIDSLSSYGDLKSYLDRRKHLLEKVSDFEDKLRASQNKITSFLLQEAVRLLDNRIEQCHHQLSQLSNEQQQVKHRQWQEFVSECESCRKLLQQAPAGAEQSSDTSGEDVFLQNVSRKLSDLERRLAGLGDTSNPIMCISSQISVLQSNLNEQQASGLVDDVDTLAQQLRSSLQDQQSSSLDSELDYTELQREIQKLQDLEGLMHRLENSIVKICRLLDLDILRVESVAAPEMKKYTCKIRLWQCIVDDVQVFLPGWRKRLEFYSMSSPLRDELNRAAVLIQGNDAFTGPLQVIQSQLENLQSTKEKLEKMKADFNKLNEVAEDLADLGVDFDQEGATLHRLEAVLLSLETTCTKGRERLVPLVEEWRYFTDEMQQAWDDAACARSNAEELVGRIEKEPDAAEYTSLAFDVQSVVSKHDDVLHESRRLKTKFEDELHPGCREDDALVVTKQLQDLSEICESLGRKSQWLCFTPLIWVARSRNLLNELKWWLPNDCGPNERFLQQLEMYTGQTASVLERLASDARLYAPEQRQQDSETEAEVRRIAASFDLVTAAASIWEIQANLHADLNRRLSHLEQAVRDCEDIADLEMADEKLTYLSQCDEQETPIIQECLLELKNTTESVEMGEAELAYITVKHWNNVYDKVNSRLCSVRVQVDGERGRIQSMLHEPLETFSRKMTTLQETLAQARSLVTECEELDPADITPGLVEDVEAMFGFEGEEEFSQLLTDCEASIDSIAVFSKSADVEDYARQLEDSEGLWQELRGHDCLVLVNFHLKNKTMSATLDAWNQQLDRADALTAFDPHLADEIEQLQALFGEDSPECDYAVGLLGELEELCTSSTARSQDLAPLLRASESQRWRVLEHASASVQRLQELSQQMLPSQKLEELRKLVGRIEVDVKSFGALLDSVDEVHIVEHTIQSIQADLQAACQQKEALHDQVASSDLDTMTTSMEAISAKVNLELKRLSAFQSIWATRLTRSASLQQQQAALQAALNGLSQFNNWNSTYRAAIRLLQGSPQTATAVEQTFLLLNDCDFSLLEYISEPFSGRISDETQALGRQGSELLLIWQKWKDAYQLWSDVLAGQQTIVQFLESVKSCCSGQLLASLSSLDLLKNQLLSYGEEVAHISNLLSNSIGNLIPEKFRTEVEALPSALKQRYTSVKALADVFFPAAKAASHLQASIAQVTPAVAEGLACLTRLGAVLGPHDAIVAAQASMKECFTGDWTLEKLDTVIESCYEMGTELSGALGRAELRASQFPEFSDVMEHVSNLKREVERLGDLHKDTSGALEELGEMWSQLEGSCGELRAYVKDCRKVFPTTQELENAASRHEVCATRLDELRTSIRTAQRKAMLVQGSVGELQTRCESDGPLCDRLTRQYRDVKAFPIALELVGKLLEVLVNSGIVQPLLLANEADLQNESIKCQVASQSLAGLRKRLDNMNASIQASYGSDGELTSLATEEGVVRQQLEQRLATVSRLREMWSKAKKEISSVMEWTRATEAELETLLTEDIAEMSSCSEQLGRMQGLVSQAQQHQEKMKQFGAQFAKLESIAPPRSTIPRPPPSRSIDTIEEGDEEEDKDAPRSDIEALQQRYADSNHQLEALLQKLSARQALLLEKLKHWSQVWTRVDYMRKVCEQVQEGLSQVNTASMQYARWPEEMERVKELEEVLTSETVMTSLQSLIESISDDDASDGDDTDGSGSARIRAVVAHRQTLLDGVMECRQELNSMAVVKVTYRGKLMEVETGNKQAAMKYKQLCRPLDTWDAVGEYKCSAVSLRQALSERQGQLAELQGLFGRMEHHIVDDSATNTRHTQCRSQYEQLTEKAGQLADALTCGENQHNEFQDSCVALSNLFARCNRLEGDLSGCDNEADLQAHLQDLSALSTRLNASEADERRIGELAGSLQRSSVHHSHAAVAELTDSLDRVRASRQSCQALLAELRREWQGVGGKLPAARRVLRDAEVALDELQGITERRVPVGSDVRTNGDAFSAALSRACHEASEANRSLQNLSASLSTKISNTLGVPERLKIHWERWSRLEAEAMASQEQASDNHDKWTGHWHDVELIEQWISGVLKNIRTLRATSLSSAWKLRATAEELKMLLSTSSLDENTCTAQGAILTQLVSEADEFCRLAPHSEANEVHAQRLGGLEEQLQTLGEEAQALQTTTNARLELLNNIDGFIDMLTSLNGAATSSAESLGSTGVRSASLWCLQDISSNFSNLHTQLDDLVSECARLKASGAILERVELSQDLWVMLQRTVQEALGTQKARRTSPSTSRIVHSRPRSARTALVSSRTVFQQLPALLLLGIVLVILYLVTLQR
eukprot:scpid2502/ scgid1884/ 